jgi:MauM/NapG family ferredoxin protein
MTRREVVRGLVFVVASAAALWNAPEPAAPYAALLPMFSPLLAFGGALASRAFSGWILLGVPVVLTSIWRGRWFCRWLCPMGFIADLVSRLHRRAATLHARVPHVGRGLLAYVLGGAALGFPLAVWTDPLSLFNGFWTAFRAPVTAAGLGLASGMALVLLASVWVPRIWCQRLCPLGAGQALLGKAGARMRRSRHAPGSMCAPAPDAEDRRFFLRALFGGLTAMAARRVLGARTPPLRPPGALPDPEFNGACARCGNCIRACPYGILHPDLGRGGAEGLLAPVMEFRDANFCFQECRLCTTVCPTGAIRRLSLEQKKTRAHAIGTAVVSKKDCLAWAKGEYCVVCQEFCPFQAITLIPHPVARDVMRPSVVRKDCRGCGACEANCPSLPKAILVQPIRD